MASFVDATLKEIDQRLADLQDEVKKLQAARAALVGVRRGPGRPRATSSDGAESGRRRSRRPGRPRGSRGGNTRSYQALELVRKEPGITIPQIASQLGIEPNYLYRVMPKLVAAGEIRRDGQGWHPANGGTPGGA